MTQVAGVNVVVAAYQETAFGVNPSPTPSGRIVYFKSLGLTASQNMIESEIMRAGRGMPRSSRGNIAVSGPLETTLAPQSVGFWLKQILGGVATAGAAAPYTHTFKPDTLPAGFVIERDFRTVIANKVDRFNGLKVSSATFNFPQEGAASVSMQLEGKKYTIDTAPLDATLDDPGHTEWSGFQGIVKRGGTQIGGILSATLKVENELDGNTYCFPGAGETPGQRFGLREGRSKISGTIDTVFENFSLIDLALAGTATGFHWLYTFGAGTGATVGNESLSFEVTDCELALQTPPIDTPSGMRVSFNYMGFLSGTDLGLEVVLKNTIAGASL